MKFIKTYEVDENTLTYKPECLIKGEDDCKYGTVELKDSGGYVNLDNITYLDKVWIYKQKIVYGMSGYIIKNNEDYLQLANGYYVKKVDVLL